MENKEKKGLNISAKSFITAIAVIFVLMVLTYVLTFIIPGGEYARTMDANGNTVIDTAKGFTFTDGGIGFFKWLFSPVLIFTADGSGAIIAVIAFLLVIGGVFNSLDKCHLVRYMLDGITARYGKKRYTLLAVMTLFFMLMGALVGSFEECVPLVPIVVALALGLGWDALTGMGMSLMAVGCGFASGVLNPFTVGVAQSLAGLPMFSGIWLRLVSLALIYPLLLVFLYRHAKSVERPIAAAELEGGFEKNEKLSRGIRCFGIIVGAGVLTVLSSSVLTFLQDYTMIIIAVMFLVGGVSAALVSGMSAKELGRTFWDGLVSILPGVLMIMMASSIKYTLTEAKILDTVLYGAVQLAGSLLRWLVILFIYLIVLVMNFFIASGSAKAFLLIPLIVPIAQIFGIPAQLCIVAFAFGDGFSNVFYPTNPVLLISLGLAGVSYGDYARWSWKFQAANLVLTCGILLFGLAVGYC